MEKILIGDPDSFIVRRGEREAIGGEVAPRISGQLILVEHLIVVGLGMEVGFLVAGRFFGRGKFGWI